MQRLAIGFFQVLKPVFFIFSSGSDRAAGFVVGAVFVAFVCAHARGQATFITGTDDNLCSYSQLLHFLV